MGRLRYVRARWPELEVPEGQPLWLLYELDDAADAVTRSVDLFPDGSVARNSIEISSAEFEAAWAQGMDRPVWSAG